MSLNLSMCIRFKTSRHFTNQISTKAVSVIELAQAHRKYNLKKADSLKIIKTIRENKLIKYHPLFDVLAKEEAKKK